MKKKGVHGQRFLLNAWRVCSIAKEERIKGLHRWASMVWSSVKMRKTFHCKWLLATIEPPLFGLGCAPLNLLQSSTSMISSTSNEYSITFTTLRKTQKPTFSLPSFCRPWLPIARILSSVLSNLTFTSLTTCDIECWKWNLHSIDNDGGCTCFSQHWDSTWTNPLFL